MAITEIGERVSVRTVVATADQSLLGLDDATVVVRRKADPVAGASAVSGLRRVTWVLLDLEGADVASARICGATRAPVVRAVSVGAALHLAAAGVPTFVRRVGAAR